MRGSAGTHPSHLGRQVTTKGSSQAPMSAFRCVWASKSAMKSSLSSRTSAPQPLASLISTMAASKDCAVIEVHRSALLACAMSPSAVQRVATGRPAGPSLTGARALAVMSGGHAPDVKLQVGRPVLHGPAAGLKRSDPEVATEKAFILVFAAAAASKQVGVHALD